MNVRRVLSKMTDKNKIINFIQNLVENETVTTQYAMILLRDFIGITNDTKKTINFSSNIDFFDLIEIYRNQQS